MPCSNIWCIFLFALSEIKTLGFIIITLYNKIIVRNRITLFFLFIVNSDDVVCGAPHTVMFLALPRDGNLTEGHRLAKHYNIAESPRHTEHYR